MAFRTFLSRSGSTSSQLFTVATRRGISTSTSSKSSLIALSSARAARSTFTRSFASRVAADGARSSGWRWRSSTAYSVLGGGLAFVALVGSSPLWASEYVDYDAVRREIRALLDDEQWDDGSWGPVLVRLAWHAAGTFDVNTRTGGSNGATMRFAPECDHGANAGLAHARARLEAVKQRHPGISYADLWTLAGTVAIEALGGPAITWRSGRSDAPCGKSCPVDGRLPDASREHDHVRAVFYRMGFNDQEIVALLGAHALGRCHTDRSGFLGPWTNSPTTFSNEYFQQLLTNKWTPKKWNGPMQYEDPSGALMMLPADLALIKDAAFRKWVEIYAEDEERFFRDFASAWQKLMELGVPTIGDGWLTKVF